MVLAQAKLVDGLLEEAKQASGCAFVENFALIFGSVWERDGRFVSLRLSRSLGETDTHLAQP
jgi:hypothetical protein